MLHRPVLYIMDYRETLTAKILYTWRQKCRANFHAIYIGIGLSFNPSRCLQFLLQAYKLLFFIMLVEKLSKEYHDIVFYY